MSWVIGFVRPSLFWFRVLFRCWGGFTRGVPVFEDLAWGGGVLGVGVEDSFDGAGEVVFG